MLKPLKEEINATGFSHGQRNLEPDDVEGQWGCVGMLGRNDGVCKMSSSPGSGTDIELVKSLK